MFFGLDNFFMSEDFFTNPILNSPYLEPSRHHALDEDGQPTASPPVDGRRVSSLLSPVPQPKRERSGVQADMALELESGDALQSYNPTSLINEIRANVSAWRTIKNPDEWGVTPVTSKLLRHWREHDFQSIRPFFCQIEAVETIIWLTEVARRHRRGREFWERIEAANMGANPELLRLALKMATGSGKTTVMAMLIAWQTLNSVRNPRNDSFTRGFLVVTPGITIKDRLRVLRPSDPDSYYRSRELVPPDMLGDLGAAKIVITNYHSFMLRETDKISKGASAVLRGRGDPVDNRETEGRMVRRVAGELMGMKNILVINDEAHHCYRENPAMEHPKLAEDEVREAKENSEAARVWITGLETFKEQLGVRAIYDLSATPFFLSGSGWPEGTLFPWTVSDFSLMDAIECGIVKLPRIPVSDNIPTAKMPVFRDLWENIKDEMHQGGHRDPNPLDIPLKLQTAFHALYGHYRKHYDLWQQEDIGTHPVFIVVCNNTTTSKLVYEWISGWQSLDKKSDKLVMEHAGNLELFRNFNEETSQPYARPRTLLIDSRQIESGKIDPSFRKIASTEIERFRRERRERGEHGEISDSELLREVMNTVGKQDRLGEGIRCVVSVSMLSEGWDANTVTHILGIRAFGTQLLCEQVVGRALRRLSYDLNENGLFDAEYADILGIPFKFMNRPVADAPRPPKKKVNVKALPEREALEIVFPNVTGYCIDLPHERLKAEFTEDSYVVIEHDDLGASQTDMSGIVGESYMLSVKKAQDIRPQSIVFNLARYLMERHFRDEDDKPKLHLYGDLCDICSRWFDEGYLKCPGDMAPWMVSCYSILAGRSADQIYSAIVRAMSDEAETKVILDSYVPDGTTASVDFFTTKDTWRTDPQKCHINYMVLDSGWEAEFGRVAENHDKVLAYMKNERTNFTVPYKDGNVTRYYYPDLIVRVDDGNEDPLNVIVEVKGIKKTQTLLKKQTVEEQWIPGVNSLGTYGRWTFAQFEDPYAMDSELKKMMIDLTQEKN